MAGVKFLVVLAVAAFDFAVVSGSKWPDPFVLNTQPGERVFKERQRLGFTVTQPIGEFKTVVCLNALNGIRKFLNHMQEKLRRRVGAVLFKGFQITKPAVFVDEGVLIVFLPCGITDKTGSRHIFNINLYPLTRILHLFIRFGFLFGVGRLMGLPSILLKSL